MELKDFQIECCNAYEVMDAKHKLYTIGHPVRDPYMHMENGGYVRNRGYEWSTGNRPEPDKTTVTYSELTYVLEGETQ